MLGALLGDIAGSYYEFKDHREDPIPLFRPEDGITDDSVLTVATLDAVLRYRKKEYRKKLLSLPEKEKTLILCYRESLSKWISAYPHPMNGYGSSFLSWFQDGMKGNHVSKGNGCAMKISPAGDLAQSEEEAIWLSRTLTRLTHDDPESLRGAECLSRCIYRARHGASKESLLSFVRAEYYPLDSSSYSDLGRNYSYSPLVSGTVPQALYCALISSSLREAITRAVSIGGDSDTLGAIAGGLAEALFPFTSKEDFDGALSIVQSHGAGKEMTDLLTQAYPEAFLPPFSGEKKSKP